MKKIYMLDSQGKKVISTQKKKSWTGYLALAMHWVQKGTPESAKVIQGSSVHPAVPRE